MKEDTGISRPGRVSRSPLSSHVHPGPPLGLCSRRSLSRPLLCPKRTHLWMKSFRYQQGGQGRRGRRWAHKATSLGPWPCTLAAGTPEPHALDQAHGVPMGASGRLSRAEHAWQAWAAAGGEPREAGGRRSVRSGGHGRQEPRRLLLPIPPPAFTSSHPACGGTTPLVEPCPLTGPPASCPGPLPV